MVKRKAKGMAMDPELADKKIPLKGRRINATWDPRQAKRRTTNESKNPSRFQVIEEIAILKTEDSSNDV